jgi:hypothetical protein
MRSLVVLVLLTAPAAADSLYDSSTKLTVGAGEETIDKAAQGTLSADAVAGIHEVDKAADSTATAEVSTELRSGATTELAASGEAQWIADYDVGGGQRMPVLGVWLDGDLGKRPALDARRDVGRQAYEATSVGFRIAPLFGAEGDRRVTALRFGFGGNKLWQAGERRAEITAEFELGYYCRLHDDAEPFCVHIFDVDGTGVSGKQQATVTNLTFARVTGLAGHFEVGLGYITDTVAIGNNAQSMDPRDTVVTENLPSKHLLAGSLGAVAAVGPLHVSLRGERTGYVSLDHDLSVEDRATLSATLAVDKRATLTATGFAARTRWWSSQMDPGSSAATGGGELAVAAHIEHFDVRAGTGIARSFYPTLDGGALGAPAIGFRSTLQVTRAIDL